MPVLPVHPPCARTHSHENVNANSYFNANLAIKGGVRAFVGGNTTPGKEAGSGRSVLSGTLNPDASS